MTRYDGGWPSYVPVAERRRKAEREMQKLRRKGQAVAPVTIEGRAIAATVWGKAWCDNLESYRDYETRLPRGRTYVRNGSVVDLQIGPREVKALVSGSSIYKVTISIASVPAAQWQSICADCAGRIDSLVELLQGRLSKGVMERMCRQGSGLFPKPSDIRFSCSCLDYASMCKHVAAALYGVGARLDRSPELLFRMRAVDENDLLADLSGAVPVAKPAWDRVLAAEDVSALFGLDMAGLGSLDAGTGGSLLHPPSARDVPATLSRQTQTLGRSSPMPSKKTSSTAALAPKAASARAARDPAGQKTKGGDASVNAEQIMPTEQTAIDAPSPGGTAASRHHSKGRHEAAQATPARIESSEQGATRAQELVLAQLESIRRGIGEVGQLRVDVQALTRRIEELAAAMAGQGQARGESVTPVMSDRDGEPKRASGKRRVTRASRPAEPGSILDASSSVEDGSSVVGPERDPGDAVPPGVAVQTPARLTFGDEAVLHALENLPKRVARPKAAGRSRK